MLKDYPLHKVFMLIEPGPVLLVTTTDGEHNNIMTITWSMVLDFSPDFALVTGPWNHSFQAMMELKECVVAVPGVDLMEKAVGIGACSGTDTDKFKRFDLTARPADKVRPPLIEECLHNIECRVADYLEPHGIVLLKAVKAWSNPTRHEQRIFHARGDGVFTADGEEFNLRALMANKLPPGV